MLGMGNLFRLFTSLALCLWAAQICVGEVLPSSTSRSVSNVFQAHGGVIRLDRRDESPRPAKRRKLVKSRNDGGGVKGSSGAARSENGGSHKEQLSRHNAEIGGFGSGKEISLQELSFRHSRMKQWASQQSARVAAAKEGSVFEDTGVRWPRHALGVPLEMNQHYGPRQRRLFDVGYRLIRELLQHRIMHRDISVWPVVTVWPGKDALRMTRRDALKEYLTKEEVYETRVLERDYGSSRKSCEGAVVTYPLFPREDEPEREETEKGPQHKAKNVLEAFFSRECRTINVFELFDSSSLDIDGLAAVNHFARLAPLSDVLRQIWENEMHASLSQLNQVVYASMRFPAVTALSAWVRKNLHTLERGPDDVPPVWVLRIDSPDKLERYAFAAFMGTSLGIALMRLSLEQTVKIHRRMPIAVRLVQPTYHDEEAVSISVEFGTPQAIDSSAENVIHEGPNFVAVSQPENLDY